jgi:hypothetical protein
VHRSGCLSYLQGYYKLLQPAPAYANAWASFQRKVDLTHKIVNLVKREDVCTLPFEEVMKRLVVPGAPNSQEHQRSARDACCALCA